MQDPSRERSDLSMLYTFAVWMFGNRAAGLKRAAEVVRAGPDLGFVGWAQAIIGPLAGPRGKSARLTERQAFLAALDDMLRTDLTVTAGDHPEIRREPRRLRVLQWELKRRCLGAVLQGVSAMPRAIFILIRIHGLSEAQIIKQFGVTQNSVKVSLGRAEQLLDNYLGARCQHLAGANSCRCDSRLGVALARGFVGWPANPEETPDLPVDSQIHANVGSLFGSLPDFTLDQSVRDALGHGPLAHPE